MVSASPTSLRKGARTRARLISATIEVLGRAGYEATSVVEITKAAAVSNATFYLYFGNKDEVIDVAVLKPAAELMWRIHSEELQIADISERTAYAVGRFISAVAADPAWAQAMLTTYSALPRLRTVMNRYSVRTLHEGIESGVFQIEGTPLQADCLNAVIMTTVRSVIDGADEPDAIDQCVYLLMSMLRSRPAAA